MEVNLSINNTESRFQQEKITKCDVNIKKVQKFKYVWKYINWGQKRRHRNPNEQRIREN